MLEIWEARRLDRVLTSGRTKPLVLECALPGPNLAGQEEATRLMVVKALGPTEMTEIGLVCQMYGNLLAQELGVLAPDCAIVNIDSKLAEAMRPRQDPPGLSAGLGVGSEYMRGGLATVVTGMTLLPDEVRQAACLYAFDLLVQNPDRHVGNPNCAFIGKDIYAYDFDTCFSFVLTIGHQAEAWEVSQHGIAPHHVFHGSLHRQQVNWKPFVGQVAQLTENRLAEIAASLPPSWQARTAKIQTHLLSAAAHPKELELELQRSIA